MEKITEEQMNTGNVFNEYIEALNKKDHAKAERLEKEALNRGVAAGPPIVRQIRHVSLRQMNAIRR